MSRFALLTGIFLLLRSCFGRAQDTAPGVADIRLPASGPIEYPAYFLADNHYRFDPRHPVDSVYIYDDHHFLLRRDSGNVFCITGPRSMEHKLIFPSYIHLEIFAGRDHYDVVIPVALFPPVRIDFFDEQQQPISLSERPVRYITGFYCHARWDYPFYAVGLERFRGSFTIDINDERRHKITSLSGWYDTNDQTRPFDLCPLSGPERINITIDERHLSTNNLGYFVYHPGEVSLELSAVNKQALIIELPH